MHCISSTLFDFFTFLQLKVKKKKDIIVDKYLNRVIKHKNKAVANNVFLASVEFPALALLCKKKKQHKWQVNLKQIKQQQKYNYTFEARKNKLQMTTDNSIIVYSYFISGF